MPGENFPKNYDHTREPELYALWEQSGAFQPDLQSNKEPFSILMPPPNANASLHAGHAMYVIQDILIRFKRMQGHPTVWFPGTDHAGYETQLVFEKHLKKEGKSRFQFDRETLYANIATFVRENSGLIVDQMKRLGFSADWSRQTFTLDDDVIQTVHNTFAQLAKDGLLYRDNYLVNYCPQCGTTFADLEIDHEERVSPLSYVRYRFSDGEPRIVNGQEMMSVVVATVRPETIFADAAIAIHPDDPRAKDLVGEYVRNPLTWQPMPIIADDVVDPEFGTGMLKITPAHDPTDFQVGRRHRLPEIATINTFGKVDLSWWNPTAEPESTRAEEIRAQFHNVSVVNARPAINKLLEAEGSLERIDTNYRNNVTVCYKAKHPIEPLTYPNWFLNMKSLSQLGLQAIRDHEVRLIPSRFTKMYETWLENIRDWPLSRQIVWGIRMPVWYNATANPDLQVTFLDTQGERHHLLLGDALQQGHTLDTIRQGLQTLRAPITATHVISSESPGDEYIQETDTFDTWFSSGQWPLVTTKYPDGDDFKRFYPTSVIDTMWDILFFWIARMVILGKHLTRSTEHPNGLPPFKTVYLHSMVTDEKGAKMSKSKGNVVNPLDLVNEFGADALRISLVAGSAPGNPIALSRAKIKGYRNFANKIWNIGRFIALQEEAGISPASTPSDNPEDKTILTRLNNVIQQTTLQLGALKFSDAALGLYDFIWNEFANTYLENNKAREDKETYLAVVEKVYFASLQLLHPFMPYVTEAVWQELKKGNRLLIQETWPTELQ